MRLVTIRRRGYYSAQKSEGEWWEITEAHDGADPSWVGILVSPGTLDERWVILDENER